MPIALTPEPSAPAIPADLTPAEFAALWRLTPEQAVAYLAARERLTATYDWRALWQDEHATQFTVSRLTRLDLLTSIRSGILASVEGDLTRRDWMRDTEALLRAALWWGTVEVIDPSTGEALETRFDSQRLRLIYDTNVRMAHAAGRWERIVASAETHPYLRYVTRDDARVRPQHAAWAGLCLPVGDPWWQTHYPPNGWRCRCRVIAISQPEYDRLLAEGSIRTTAPEIPMVDWTNKYTGETASVPYGIDPGFGYNVGIAAQRARRLAEVSASKLAAAGPALAAAARDAGLTL